MKLREYSLTGDTEDDIIKIGGDTMRIATYNIWNNTATNRLRFPQLIDTIHTVRADVIALQETTPQFYRDAVKLLSNYPNHVYAQYTGEEEGLALFSQYPILSHTFLHTDGTYRADALHCIIACNSIRLSVTNVHFPWDSAKERERQIVSVQKFLDQQSADYHFLLGDLNCSERSAVHGFLLGDCTLLGEEANPVWLDIAGNYAVLRKTTQAATLDPMTNPRWNKENTTHRPEVYDRIYIRDNRKSFAFRYADVFGTEVSTETGLCPSDHYGVLADVELPDETAEKAFNDR